MRTHKDNRLRQVLKGTQALLVYGRECITEVNAYMERLGFVYTGNSSERGCTTLSYRHSMGRVFLRVWYGNNHQAYIRAWGDWNHNTFMLREADRPMVEDWLGDGVLGLGDISLPLGRPAALVNNVLAKQRRRYGAGTKRVGRRPG